ncbi:MULTISPECIES: right-handed parallel beta-helix repeat-containing protein [unclassified Rhizobium]|uniref:right-handed parallel beta-helix repeat-containing protein n=1 Tax=unclassified Rhizobium TaxID=2613769 RepID=UPI001A985E81|nr:MULTISPECIES: right-handed parallel beta-helix repeat-containing protein [unclassified Rhizobium]MBX5158013.1 right-handed parallel beta-helix repeat-containing protein [Rhizobium sp. NZLR8]MBX5167840.1 right-handed parallel beta-helix repeat-containing protein [Rhizobium sp. NZLR4b]MBX5172331.1 right-handed parallel beta-helix repeat-containing protein [Rhizobium sp. NZLR1b]MBX5186029.1 right-handed parallel beta-helix repeat-containing protein [Rhizobium sp. NZLR5]MBX5192869.1 right-hande
MTTYYVNSAIGSNQNSGTSEKSAFATLSKVESLTLKAGDSVLLAKGSVFNEQFDIKNSGSASAPIKIGSYGTGDAPVIHSGGDGIHSLYASNIVIENLKISNTGGAAIYGGDVTNWTVRNVEIAKSGMSENAGAVTFRNSKNVTIEDSKISDVKGDGFWIEKVSGVKLLNNTVTSANGSTADAVQVNDSSNILIKGNHLDQTDASSPKGVIALVRATDAVVENNTLTGGGFGISAPAGKNVAIRDNDISGFHGYSWSFAVGLGDQGSARDYDISGNHIHDGAWGVAVSGAIGTSYTLTNIKVHDNVFDDLTQSALKVDRPASGTFYNNTIESGVNATSLSPAVVDAHTFSVSNNHTVANVETALASTNTKAAAVTDAAADPAIAAVHDNLKILTDTGAAHHGNLLENDSSDNGTLVLRRFGDESVGKHGLTLTGDYGSIHVDREGNYAYTLDDTKLPDHSGHVSESFSYGVDDGTSHHSDADTLTVFIHTDGLLS